jgi:hypothetical protein
VLPFFDSPQIKLLRVLTDRGSEYCGKPERHEYELYLAVEDIDHSRTKTKSPQTTDVIDKCFFCGIWTIFLSRTGDREAKSRARGASLAAQPSLSHLICGACARPLRTARVPTSNEPGVGRLGLLDPSALELEIAQLPSVQRWSGPRIAFAVAH